MTLIRNFESGDLTGLEVIGSSNAPEIVQDPVRAGQYAMRTYVHREAAQPYRTEAKVMDDSGITFELTHHEEFYYAISIFLPTDFELDPNEQAETLLQIHHRPDDWNNPGPCTQPMFALRINLNRWEAVVRGWTDEPAWDLGDLKLGEWTNWTIATVQSEGDDGLTKIWKNGLQLVDWRGSTTKCEFQKQPKISFGLYKWSWRPKHSQAYWTSVVDRTYYHDEFRIGKTYEEVQPKGDPMSWFAIYETAAGRLESLGTTKADPLPPGLAFLEFTDRPDDEANMWDEASLSYIPRPAKVFADRWDDIINDPSTRGLWIAMNAVNRGKLKTSITTILGDERFRNLSESPAIGGDDA